MLTQLLFAASTLLPQDSTAPHKLIELDPALLGPRMIELAGFGFDHVGRNAETGLFEVAVDGDQLARLRSLGLPHRVKIDDLERFYASRLDPNIELGGSLGAWLSPPFGNGAMGGYYTFAQVASVLDQINAAYPSITTAKVSLGNTVEGRSLWMLKVSDNPGVDESEPEVRIDAMHHAREPEGMQATLWFLLYLVESYASDPQAQYLVNQREIFFVPCVNPDGYVYNQTTNPGGGGMWRKNRRNNGGGIFGVDLNRNYPEKWGWDDTGSSPFTSDETYRGPSASSEPEVTVLKNWIASRSFQTALSVHTYSNLWLYPYGYANLLPANVAQYDELSLLQTAVNGYVIGAPWEILYLANGITPDYDHNVKGTMSWTPEIGGDTDGFWPPSNRIIPLAEENLLALQVTSLAGGAFARVLSTNRTEVGDGDGFFEVGETARFVATVRNSGRLAPSTGVTLALTSASPHVSITSGSIALGVIASFSQTNNNANPLAFTILPSAPGGTSIAYSLDVTYEGWTQSFPGSLVVGEPRPFLIDDAEVDWGWTKGVVGDTATIGFWVRGSPVGTNSSGTPANPSVDASPPPGVNCFMTGNGGGSAGTDDVDNGSTTLLSPLFDLSNVGSATLSYARWHADLSTADDVFQISISNNGGSSWAPLESIAGNANTWVTSSFIVSDYVAQTNQMRLRFVASDSPNNSVVEAAVDDLKLTIYDAAPRLHVYGTPKKGQNVRYALSATPNAPYVLWHSSSGPQVPGSPFHQASALSRTVQTGAIPSTGLLQLTHLIPNNAALVGRTIWLKASVAGAPSNWTSYTVLP